MLRRKATSVLLIKDVDALFNPGKSSEKSTSALNFYQNVRHAGGSRFHRRITYSMKIERPRKNFVEPKLLKFNEPVSSSMILPDMVSARKFEFDMDSLCAKGFYRHQKAYDPPPNAEQTVIEICRSCMNSTEDDAAILKREFANGKEKFEVLTKIFEAFQHGVPNSLLYMMKSVGDVVDFYCTRVNINTPYEDLVRNPSLPPNLHIQKEPLRWHPDDDTKFGGQTAFTKSSTIVTGLKSKKKYKGYEAKMTWP